MEEEKKNFFRKTAIENMTNPEELNKLIYFGISGSWIIIISIIGLIISFIIWGVFASFPVSVDSVGIILNKSKLHPVMANMKGIITEVNADRGDIINSNKILAKIKASEYTKVIDNIVPLTSPYNGIIIQKWIYPSLYVSESDVVFTVEEPDFFPHPMVLAYIPSDAGHMVKPGMDVHITMKNLEYTYGFIKGKVDSVSSEHSTRELMLWETGNFQTVDDIIKNSKSKFFYTSVLITLMEKQDGTYQWSQKNPSFSLMTGSLCNCSIITGKRHLLR